MSKRGFLLIALGDSYYGTLASTLAASLKITCPDIPIHLVKTESAMRLVQDKYLDLFDTVQECPSQYYTKNDKQVFIKSKTHMYELSPFEETIFLDVDVIACPNLPMSRLFDDLNHLDFTMENRSRIDLANHVPNVRYMWAKVEDLKEAHGLTSGYLYGLHSEFVYFKKNDRIKAFFDDVQQYFMDPGFKHLVFDGDTPDELGFALAMIKHELYPHECPFIPLFWFLTDSKLGSGLSYIFNNYHGYSVGGNATPPQVRQKYDSLARSYYGRLGLQHRYPIRTKRQALRSRKLL